MIDIKEFLLENDVTIYCHDTKRHVIVDEAYTLGGEFVVYENGNLPDPDIYRGDDFEEAMKFLTGKE